MSVHSYDVDDWWRCPGHTTGREYATEIRDLESLIEEWPNIPVEARTHILIHASWHLYDLGTSDAWLRLFREAGPVALTPPTDDASAPHELSARMFGRPAGRTRLYRGVHDDASKYGTAWTPSLAVARFYSVCRIPGTGGLNVPLSEIAKYPDAGIVYSCDAPPEALFAPLPTGAQGWIVDPYKVGEIKVEETGVARSFIRIIRMALLLGYTAHDFTTANLLNWFGYEDANDPLASVRGATGIPLPDGFKLPDPSGFSPVGAHTR